MTSDAQSPHKSSRQIYISPDSDIIVAVPCISAAWLSNDSANVAIELKSGTRLTVRFGQVGEYWVAARRELIRLKEMMKGNQTESVAGNDDGTA